MGLFGRVGEDPLDSLRKRWGPWSRWQNRDSLQRQHHHLFWGSQDIYSVPDTCGLWLNQTEPLKDPRWGHTQWGLQEQREAPPIRGNQFKVMLNVQPKLSTPCTLPKKYETHRDFMATHFFHISGLESHRSIFLDAEQRNSLCLQHETRFSRPKESVDMS